MSCRMTLLSLISIYTRLRSCITSDNPHLPCTCAGPTTDFTSVFPNLHTCICSILKSIKKQFHQLLVNSADYYHSKCSPLGQHTKKIYHHLHCYCNHQNDKDLEAPLVLLPVGPHLFIGCCAVSSMISILSDPRHDSNLRIVIHKI
jgi:hypothetical protein